jgi:hypothetical protein
MFDESPGELVEAISESRCQESKLMARRMAAVAELLAHRTAEVEVEDPDPGYMIITGFHRTTAEVAAAMNLSPMAASFVVSHAEALDTRLPKVAAVLAAGDTDWRTVQLIIARTELVSDSAVNARLDASLAARISKWHCWSRKRIINAVDAAVRALDPDAIRERVRLEDKRRIDVTALGDGTAKVDGVITADAAAAFDQRLSELAKAVCPNDPRTMAQRRADALKALSDGRWLACACGAGDCPNRSDHAAPATRLVLNVIAGQQTVIGGGSQPGYIEGYGVIDADKVRELARDATLRLLNEPSVSPAEALRYQPTAALERWVRMRDLTCRFPGCDRPAIVCDIDHTIPFNHVDPASGGLTVPSNLKCMCLQHHRLKTFHDGWHDVQLEDGTVIWTSPTGEPYRTAPGSIDLFPELRAPVCNAPKLVRRNRSRQRAARIARIRTRNRVQRPINEAARRLNRARRQEIEYRRWRNHMRDMLAVFKGKPSTSPFCTWVNDPYEPEELPPSWEPPPKPPSLPDDEPPF